MNISEMTVLIPVFKPEPKLADFVRSLLSAGARTVVVDDGSGPDFAAVFDAVQRVGVHRDFAACG